MPIQPPSDLFPSSTSIDRRTAIRRLAVGAGFLTATAIAGGTVFGRARRVADPVATTAAGQVRGYLDHGVFAFRGIPYGGNAATFRFSAPVPPTPWTGIRDAVELPAIAPQLSSEGLSGSEDCLRLHVWTPALRDGGKRPVMVWFHGGGYSGGSGNSPHNDGVRLCNRGDVVVVAVNHRLNALGFLYLAELGGPDLANSGNAGMLDLVLALKWVRENIAEFGGDPGTVMIFGESGGGAKCATLMGMPAARGLFHRVATQSGQQITGARRSTGTANARALLEALHLGPDQVASLRTLPLEKLMEASRAVRSWAPVTDGGALPRDPFDPDAPPLARGIPMLLGNNRDETRSLIGGGDPGTFDLTWDTLIPTLDQTVSPFLGELDRNTVVSEYRRWYPDYSPSDVFFAVTTAARSWRGQVIEADRRAAQPAGSAPTWVYQLDWPSPIQNGRMKAFHGLDVPLVFDNVALAPEVVGTKRRSPQRMADQMSEAWITFARIGRPGAKILPPWPTFNLTRRATMVFDLDSHVLDDPRGNERRLFEKVVYIQPGT
jgi:para-nitrobenzyl esterase